jgi:hypothetical protein
MVRNLLRRPISYMLLAILALQFGCATQSSSVGRTPVPGSNIYCLNTKSTKEFRENLKTSYVGYGPFQRHVIGGDSSICDLIQFYTYTVSWETKDGRKERYEFEVEKLMKKLQEDKPVVATLTQHSSQPQLRVEYLADQIQIYFHVSQYQLDGMEIRNGLQVLTKPAIVSKFPLLTVPLTSQAATPAIK